MIDLHIHILPGVDDGAPDMAASLAMAYRAYKGGTGVLCVTPHCNIPRGFNNMDGPELYDRLTALRRAVSEEGIPLEIYSGMEIYASPDLPDLLREGRVWTYNHTRYFLVEFGFDEDPRYCSSILRECVKAGFSPVIAHPARYTFVQEDPQIVWDWYQAGYGIQLNKDSILGRFGRRVCDTANLLLGRGLVSIAATDAHGIRSRTADMSLLRSFLMERYGPRYTYMLLEENPRRILSGRRLVGMDPVPFPDEGQTFR